VVRREPPVVHRVAVIADGGALGQNGSKDCGGVAMDSREFKATESFL